jgi:hypothetical protein
VTGGNGDCVVDGDLDAGSQHRHFIAIVLSGME